MQIDDKEDLVEIEVAILAKEAGFDWPVWNYFYKAVKWETSCSPVRLNFNDPESSVHKEICRSRKNGVKLTKVTSRPSQDLLSKWLRTVHKKTFIITDEFDENEELSFGFIEGDLGYQKDNLEHTLAEEYSEAVDNAQWHILTEIIHKKNKLTYEDYLEKYKPICYPNSIEVIIHGYVGDNLKKAKEDNKLWSIISGGRGSFSYLVKGYHYVDVEGYMIAEVPYEEGSEGDEEGYLY